MTLLIMLTVVLALSGLAMHGLTRRYLSPAGLTQHLRESKGRPISEEQFQRYARINSVLSLALVYGPAWALQGIVLHSGPVSPLRVVLEGVAVLLVYDFGYYLVHRYPFHEWRLLRAVHAVHHTIKNPNARDSLYQHPLENFLGLTLFWLTWVVVAAAAGPLSIYSFGWTFLFYSLVNVLNHAGLRFKTFPLTALNYLGMRHYKHHTSMKSKNYGSIFPFYDWVFRTEEA